MEIFTAPDVVRGEGLIIRPYTIGDADALCHASVGSYDHLRRFMPWANTDQTVEVTEAIIGQFRTNYTEGTDFVLGIWREADGEFMGGCGYHLREGPLEGACAEMGMWIAAAHARQGVGKRALALLIRWGFTEWPWLRLSWRCNSDNSGSVGCAEANGMILEGTLRGQYEPVRGGRRDTLCYGLLREDWASSQE